MPLDPNIPLSGISVVNPLQLAQVQQAGVQLQQQRQAQADQMMLRDILRQPTTFDTTTGMVSPQAMPQIFAASPESGMSLLAHNAAVQQRQAQQDYYRARAVEQLTAAQRQKMELARDADAKAYNAYDAAKASGASEETARQRGAQIQSEEFNRLKSSGLFPDLQMPGEFDPELVQRNMFTVKELLTQRMETQREVARDKRAAEQQAAREAAQERSIAAAEARQEKAIAAADARAERRAAKESDTGLQFDDQDLDYAAQLYRQTGVMPSLGQGKLGTQARAEVLKRAGAQARSEGGSGFEDVARQRSVRADTASLTQLQKMYDAVESFSNSEIANGRVLVDLAKKVDQTGVPVIERWTRAGRKAIAGDPDVSRFDAQMRIFRNGMAKIITNPNLTGVLTVEAQREMAEVLPNAATAKQIEGVVNLLQGDVNRRRKALEDQRDAIKSRISGKSSSDGSKPGGTIPRITNEADYNALPSGTKYIDPDGTQRTKR